MFLKPPSVAEVCAASRIDMETFLACSGLVQGLSTSRVFQGNVNRLQMLNEMVKNYKDMLSDRVQNLAGPESTQ